MNPYRPYPPRSYPRQSSIPTSVFLSGLAAIGAGVAAACADYENAPLVAPYLDAITRHVFTWIPALQRLPEDAWFATGGAEAGLAVFVVCMVARALFGSPGAGSSGRMQAQLKRRLERQKRAHRAGFNE